MESDSVLYAVGLIQCAPIPVSKNVVVRNRRRGPVPRKLDVGIHGDQRCYVCKETKSLIEFSADRTRPNGRMSRCKKCNNKRIKEYHKTPRGRARYRRYMLKRSYGLSVEQYEQMIRNQDGLCAICKESPKNKQRKQFYVDHNHETGNIRGLLCGTCNSAIGLMQENPDSLRRAAEYLEKYNGI